jgi:hypothetical protein
VNLLSTIAIATTRVRYCITTIVVVFPLWCLWS